MISSLLALVAGGLIGVLVTYARVVKDRNEHQKETDVAMEAVVLLIEKLGQQKAEIERLQIQLQALSSVNSTVAALKPKPRNGGPQ